MHQPFLLVAALFDFIGIDGSEIEANEYQLFVWTLKKQPMSINLHVYTLAWCIIELNLYFRSITFIFE